MSLDHVVTTVDTNQITFAYTVPTSSNTNNHLSSSAASAEYVQIRDAYWEKRRRMAEALEPACATRWQLVELQYKNAVAKFEAKYS